MRSMKRVSVLATGLAAAGALLLSGCGSSTTAADPTVPAVAAVPAVSAPAAPTPAASAPAAPAAPAAAESAAAQVVEASTCENDGTNAACACEGEAASCEETVLKARTDDGGLFGRKEGYVKWYDEGKGYGFISGDDGGADLFVHRSHVLGSTILKSGQRVSYELISDGLRGKPSLSNVQVL